MFLSTINSMPEEKLQQYQVHARQRKVTNVNQWLTKSSQNLIGIKTNKYW